MDSERSTLVKECYRLADEARRLASLQSISPDEKADLLEVVERWLAIARSRQIGGKITPAAT
jgi:hypothetical protein